jgi:hypothetical protein
MTNQIDYTQEWLDLGYRNGMASASFLPPPAKEFIRVYHLRRSEHAMEDIELSRLKVALFSDVNDPFELGCLNFRYAKNRKWSQLFKRDYEKKIGLLCFSSDWKSPLLWSHYAEGHKGICLGFDLRRTRVEEVVYTDKRLHEQVPDEAEPGDVPLDLRERLTKTKSSLWKYEEELRVFVDLEKEAKNEQGLYFKSFDDDMRLAEAILGHRCVSGIKKVKRLVHKTSPDAVTFRARLAYGAFEVKLDGNTRPSVDKASAPLGVVL